MLNADQIDTRYAKSGELNIAYQVFGTGLSDTVVNPPTLEERMGDVRAVIDAAGWERAFAARESRRPGKAVSGSSRDR